IKVIAQVPDGPPARFVWRRATHAVVRAEGPERVAMEWWRSQGEMLTRDYFRVEDEAGLRFWLYRDGLYDREIVQEEGKAVQPNWYMHGLFASPARRTRKSESRRTFPSCVGDRIRELTCIRRASCVFQSLALPTTTRSQAWCGHTRSLK